MERAPVREVLERKPNPVRKMSHLQRPPPLGAVACGLTRGPRLVGWACGPGPRLGQLLAPEKSPDLMFWLVTSGFGSVQLLSRVQLFVTTWTAARQASQSITHSRSLLNLMSIESVMPSSYLILCPPLLFLPSSFPSTRVFSSEAILGISWPKNCSFSFSICPSNEYSGLNSHRMDWFHLLAVQGTLKSLLQHHRSKTSILWHSAFFIVQLSLPYMTSGLSEVK